MGGHPGDTGSPGQKCCTRGLWKPAGLQGPVACVSLDRGRSPLRAPHPATALFSGPARPWILVSRRRQASRDPREHWQPVVPCTAPCLRPPTGSQWVSSARLRASVPVQPRVEMLTQSPSVVHKVLECFHAATPLRPRCFLQEALDKQNLLPEHSERLGVTWLVQPWKATRSSLGRVFPCPGHLLPHSKPSPPPLSSTRNWV